MKLNLKIWRQQDSESKGGFENYIIDNNNYSSLPKNKICNNFPYLKINIDGEIQVDAALVPEVCKKKFVNSCLKGMANILIFSSDKALNIL